LQSESLLKKSTNEYLLALTCAHGGKLAKFDRRLVVDEVRDSAKDLHLIA
jgi:hypothetical protein